MGLLFVVALVVLALAVSPGIGAAQEDVTSCRDFDEPGTPGEVDYRLNSPINDSSDGQCLNVRDGASDVWIDGQGHTIDLGEESGDHGVLVQGDGATITNLTVVGGGQGIYVLGSAGTELRNVEIRDVTDRGIWIQDATDTLVTDADVSGADQVGVRINPTQDEGITDNVSIEDLTATSNAVGVHVTDGNSHEIRDSNVSANDGDGITVDGDADVAVNGTSVRDNGGDALHLNTDSAQGSNVDIGTSTDPGTTLSFSPAAYVSLNPVADPSAAPENETAIRRYFDVEQAGSSASQLDAAVHYTDEDAKIVNESTLDLWRADGSGGWTEIADSSADESERTVNASLTEFGTFGAFGQGESFFDVAIEEANASVLENGTLEVTANVTNTGGVTGTQAVNLSLNGSVGEVVDTSESVTLDEGENTSLDFTWNTTGHGAGSYEATVASDNDSDSRTIDVEKPANFAVTVHSESDSVVAGQAVDVNATVTNDGDRPDTQNVTLVRDGDQVDSEEVPLSGGEDTQIALTWTTDSGDVGDHDLAVGSEDDSANASVTVLAPANFQVSIDGTNEPVQGEVLTVAVNVSNVGDEEGKRTVSVNVSGATAQENVTIGGGNETSVTLDVETDSLSPGNHSGNVTAGDSSAEFDVTIEESTGGGLPPGGGGDPEPVVSIEGTNSPVGFGETVRVTTTVTNPGDASTTETVTLTAGGAERDSEQVQVGANGEETVVLEWDTGSGDAGRQLVEVAVGSSTDSTSVTVDEDSPAIEVTIDETTSPVVEREPLEVTATLEANEDASQTARLVTPGGETVDSRDVDLSAGESETVTLVWQTERGDATSGFLRVESGDDVATTDVSVEETPAFAVDVTGTSSPVDAEETLTVDARVSSEEDEARRGYVTLEVDGEIRDAQVVTLDGSEDTETVALTWETGAGDAGEYDATVDVGADSAAAGVSVEEDSGPLFPYAPEWTGSAVDYEFSSQDTHVGVFFWLTLLVGGLGAYLLATRATLDARLLGVTLLVAGVRTGTDVLHATVGGAALEPLLALNTALELYVGLLFLAFAAAYVDDDALLERRSVAGLAGVAAVGTLAIATNFAHGLVFSDAELAEAAFTYVTAQTGPLGWAILSVTLVSLLFSVGLLVQSFLAGTEPEWRPVGVLASGLCLALLVVALSVLERGPLPHYDYTGAGVAGFLALTTTTLFGHGLQRIKHHAQRSLIEDLEDPIVVANDRRVVVEYNDAAAELLPGIAAGVRFDRLVASAPDWPSSGDSTTAEQSRSGLLPTRSSASSDTGAVLPATPDHADLEASEQAEVHYLVQTTSVTADTGDSIGYTVRFTDVSELKRRTNALARKNAQLEQVASTISHDLRNPLSVADGYVDIMQDNVPAPGQQVRASDVEDHLGPIQRAVDRMEAIIDDILALARSAESVSTTEAVEYDELVEEAWRTVDTDEATLFIESTGLVDADGQRLRRILENLFRNAVEHAGDDVAVVTGITDDGFYVADDGPGIPDAERGDVFEEGYSSAADGTGLGLAIVRQLASAHDWEVHLDPEYDGARFVFTGATTMAHREGPTSGALQHD